MELAPADKLLLKAADWSVRATGVAAFIGEVHHGGLCPSGDSGDSHL